MSTTIFEAQFLSEENPEFLIAYNPAVVSIGIRTSDCTLAINLTPNSAVKLLLQLRESLEDLNSEG